MPLGRFFSLLRLRRTSAEGQGVALILLFAWLCRRMRSNCSPRLRQRPALRRVTQYRRNARWWRQCMSWKCPRSH